MSKIEEILIRRDFTKENLVVLLTADDVDTQLIFDKAAEIKTRYVGNKVFFRGLTEISNKCAKNCFYCGIRAANTTCKRYELSNEEVLETIKYSYDNRFGSIVMQAGERSDKAFIEWIDNLLKKISEITNGEIGITLSLGEQTEDTYRRWLKSGASRYLLRIESSNRQLFEKIHPIDKNHDFGERIAALKRLQKVGYQTGTGVMIGLPFQTIEDLADDILFMREFDIDMVGMGPYIEHEQTPMYQYREQLMSLDDRFLLTLKMIAILRIVMKDINIASATALQAIDPHGREKGLKVGANVIMPNITPVKYHEAYSLYKNKPTVNELTDAYINDLEAHIHAAGDVIAYGEQGNPKHFYARKGEIS